MNAYDKKITNLFKYWILISFLLVFIMVGVGGLTRLTNSGLSITEWELFSGILPPLNQNSWNEYFLLYRKIPQYELINKDMTMSNFKIIFYWEYFHRLLGRVIGLFFLIPLVFFYFKRKVLKKYMKICYFVLFLIVLQGTVGWYMVESGLVNNITVSHYRLSLHLILAFIILSILFWILLNVKHKSYLNFFENKRNNYPFFILFILFYLQIIVGAFVSGLDAGQIYQTWPLMNYSYFPDDTLIDKISNLLNFDNPGLVQFYHRNIAYLIMIYILIFGYFIYKNNLNKIFVSYYLVLILLIFQILLGIMTLITGLNIFIAFSHQICSLLLVLSFINLYYKYKLN